MVGPYSKDGKLYALPYSAATPILYYNKDAFKKAGLDPEKPPRTWPTVAEHAKKLLASGTKCGFSTGRPSWTMVENMHAIHDQPVATKNNGLGAVEGVELLINREFGQKHIGALADWQENIYSYSGRGNAADPRYINGDCPMYIQSSAPIGPFAKAVKFDWGTGELPQWGPPYRKATSITDGGALWALKGRPQAEYRGAARFLDFLAKPEQQMWWHVTTGDLVISHTAREEPGAGLLLRAEPQAVHRLRPDHRPAADGARRLAGQEGGAGQAGSGHHAQQHRPAAGQARVDP